MGIFDRIQAKAMPNDDYDDVADYDEYAEYDEKADGYYESDAVTPIRPVDQAPEVARIVTVWVSTFRDAADFALEFRNGLPVVLNLSDAADDERKRIVDFAYGLTFGLEGSFNAISDDVFLLTPNSVKIDSYGTEATRVFN
ncbi:cell division protein SepF [Trueperella pyogenes]|uniref:cell division protein SepF n=1 Tax=Trueperella pyogenes TaxID=1661 RepID=UPI00312B4987